MNERLSRDPAAIRQMFNAIAPRYDVLNRFLSLRRDVGWRRALLGAVQNAPPGPLLDVATGTGDVALAVDERPVVGCDFSLAMLFLARQKAHAMQRKVFWVAADALQLPFPSGAFSALTVAFGVRNLVDLDAGLLEMRRVLCPGGRLAILEIHTPASRWLAILMSVWNRLVVTPIGRMVSPDGSAYDYLPASVRTFPSRAGLAVRLTTAGMAVVASQDLSGGIAGLNVARRHGEEL